jgi:long-chain acyl-CoA synthetase
VVDRFWLQFYPGGVPHDVDPDAWPSLPALLDHSLARHASRVAYVCMGAPMTYAELDTRSRAFAAWLQSRGLGRGTRVAIMLPNLLQFPVAAAGALRAGCTVACVNPLYTPRELEHQLKDCGAEAIVILENFAHTLQQVLPRTALRHVVVTSVGELLGPVRGRLVDVVVRRVKKLVPPYRLPGSVRFGATLAAGARAPWAAPAIGPDDVAFLQYTGGTTGVSKGAMLTHRNVTAAILQCEAWGKPADRRIAERFGEGSPRTTLCALPLYHIYMLALCFGYALKAGGTCLLIPNPRDVPALVRALRRHPVHAFPALSTLFGALASHPEFRALDFSTLMFAGGGGMATLPAVAEQWQRLTGVPLGEGYGLSETCAIATSNPAVVEAFSGTVGLPMPSTEISLRDDDGREVPLGERGEVCIRGPQVMAGYWNRPDETARAFTADGFFRSGDIGVMNARGHLKIVDRKKDMIIVSGFNVFPNEIEEVVTMHPGVLEAAAVGVPDPHSGEAVQLFVVRRDPALTEADLIAWCAGQLTGYKKPRRVLFRAELPKSNVGKILRRELRDAASVTMLQCGNDRPSRL